MSSQAASGSRGPGRSASRHGPKIVAGGDRATRLWDRQGQRHRHTNTHNYSTTTPSLCHWDRQRQRHRHGPDGRVLVAGTRRSSGAIEKSPYLRAALDTRIPGAGKPANDVLGRVADVAALRTARLRPSDRLAWFVGHDGLRSGFWQGRTCAAPSLPAALAHRHNHFNLIILRALDNLPTRRGLASF